MRLAQAKFEEDTDFKSISGNKADIKVQEFEKEGEFDLEKHLESISFNHEKDRLVLGRLANNESLPFKSQTFDCYLACLSLMLVDNHTNMLEEAFRVTSTGASLGFVVWGRKQNIQNFEILDDVLEKHGLKPLTPPPKTSYDLGKDPEKLKGQFEKVGFSKIRMWYQPMNFNFADAE